ncbi:MAG: hypothetical protein BJ554DRAFT_446 [Olpidium bornovanus]|uniref:Uncharacterized protein n=1 Tax=Olpidium bornovanus TaxID=278681 RepID=A0A8H7ZU27_9FUNG|nr:MAG: hypothetical protein BJ554DRAFT_446 [Olpidium bornovanus]
MARSLSEAEWLLILEQEAAEFLAESVVDEVLQRSQDVLFEKHIESQVLPYAVQFCKKTIENMVEVRPLRPAVGEVSAGSAAAWFLRSHPEATWRFFKCDPGEVDPSVWVAGEGPETGVMSRSTSSGPSRTTGIA